jgi:diaminohydroxyphosphoribosylaminopyrimidine deaminase / 5-amino-6-(5-phosphoribosylamino)uracil reductase
MHHQHHNTDEFFMQRALDLAVLGHGNVSPNPMVGCVIVHDNKIIGEGWHRKYGEAHAEVNAVQAVAHKTLLKASTVYVSLEPCSHFGKTPPCADMLIRENVKKVVVANLDSNPLVAGEGIRKLRAAGIEVVTGVLQNEGRVLNKRFFTFMEHQRPYIILKWAETADGFVARSNFDSKWISHALSRQLVHRWRTEEDAVLVGSRTAQHDNPRLNVRDWTGRDPVRVFIDRTLQLDNKLNLFDGSQRTICYNLLKDGEHDHVVFVKLEEEGFLQHMVSDLYRQRIQSLIVEGGAHTLQAFIDAGLWDEARVFYAPLTFGGGIAAPRFRGRLHGQRSIRTDVLKVYYPPASPGKAL